MKLVVRGWKEGGLYNVLGDLFNTTADPTEQQAIESDYDLSSKLLNDLNSWWDGVVDDPSSFTTPVFQVGWGNDKLALVPGSGSVDSSSGIFQQKFGLTWPATPEHVLYTLDFLQGQKRYAVVMTHLGATAGRTAEVDMQLEASGWQTASRETVTFSDHAMPDVEVYDQAPKDFLQRRVSWIGFLEVPKV